MYMCPKPQGLPLAQAEGRNQPHCIGEAQRNETACFLKVLSTQKAYRSTSGEVSPPLFSLIILTAYLQM